MTRWRWRKTGPVILVRKETTPDDIHGMDVAKGILTAVGGKSSHAAVVARGMGRPCVVGAGTLAISERTKQFTTTIGGKAVTVKEGDWISLDGTTANVYLGKATTNDPDPNSSYFGKLMNWADEFRGKIRRARQCGHSARREGRAAVRRRRHRTVPHRAHVLRRGSHSSRAGDDSGSR